MSVRGLSDAELVASISTSPSGLDALCELHQRLKGLRRGEAQQAAQLDAIAFSLHPHWPKGACKTYLPDQLPEKIEELLKWNHFFRETFKVILGMGEDE